METSTAIPAGDLERSMEDELADARSAMGVVVAMACAVALALGIGSTIAAVRAYDDGYSRGRSLGLMETSPEWYRLWREADALRADLEVCEALHALHHEDERAMWRSTQGRGR